LFSWVAKLGLDSIVVREVINDAGKSDIFVGTAFWLKVIGAIIALCLIAIAVQFTSNSSQTNIFIFIIAIGMLFQSFEVAVFYYQAKVNAKVVSICKILQLLISSFVKIYFIVIDADLVAFVLVSLFDQVILSLFYIITYRINIKRYIHKRFDIVVAKRMLLDSWPLILSAIFVMLYARIDQIMIMEMLGEYEVGIYSVSVKITEAWLFFPIIVSSSLFPSILNAKNRSLVEFETRMKWLYSLVSVSGLVVAITVTIFSKFLIGLLFGNEYIDGSPVLAIRIWETVFAAIGIVSTKWIVAENLQRITFVHMVIGSLMNIVLNFILIPSYGVRGAAIASIISIIVTVIILPLLNKQLRDNAEIRIKSLLLVFLVQKITRLNSRSI